jgi:hypothetical protein
MHYMELLSEHYEQECEQAYYAVAPVNVVMTEERECYYVCSRLQDNLLYLKLYIYRCTKIM